VQSCGCRVDSGRRANCPEGRQVLSLRYQEGDRGQTGLDGQDGNGG